MAKKISIKKTEKPLEKGAKKAVAPIKPKPSEGAAEPKNRAAKKPSAAAKQPETGTATKAKKAPAIKSESPKKTAAPAPALKAKKPAPAKTEEKAVRTKAATAPKEKKARAAKSESPKKTAAPAPALKAKKPAPAKADEKAVRQRKTAPAVKAEAGLPKKRIITRKARVTGEKEKPGSPPAPSVIEKLPVQRKSGSKLLTRSRAALKIFLPRQMPLQDAEEETIFFEGLPDEYGETSLFALPVDPNTVFVDWEIIPADISGMEGELNLRFYDVTGIEFSDWRGHATVDMPIGRRVGNGIFELGMPGCDVVVAAGLLDRTTGFMPIVRSEMISFPALLSVDELGIALRISEAGLPLGY